MWFEIVLPALPQNGPCSRGRGVALDLGSMGKGAAWVNGEMVGRYWLIRGNCSAVSRNQSCGYAGEYVPYGPCCAGSGHPTQQYYHVPAAWLHWSGSDGAVTAESKPVDPSPDRTWKAVVSNRVVLFEEEDGADPAKVAFVHMEF